MYKHANFIFDNVSRRLSVNTYGCLLDPCSICCGGYEHFAYDDIDKIHFRLERLPEWEDWDSF